MEVRLHTLLTHTQDGGSKFYSRGSSPCFSLDRRTGQRAEKAELDVVAKKIKEPPPPAVSCGPVRTSYFTDCAVQKAFVSNDRQYTGHFKREKARQCCRLPNFGSVTTGWSTNFCIVRAVRRAGGHSDPELGGGGGGGGGATATC
jgi:hypothetical protein